MTYAVVDIETTTITTYKRKANPFDDENWIVLSGWKKKGDKLPSSKRMTKDHQSHGWLVTLLEDKDIRFLVGQNIKFDLLHLLKDPVVYKAWQKFVVRGGLVWDVQLAEYLLDGMVQSSHMLSLDDLALRYGGDTKVDEVKLLWDAGVPTEDIDPDLLLRYLVGEDLKDPLTGQLTGRRREGDIGNTETVFLGQLERAKKQGQSRSILMNMGALCCTVEMERNGMYVNKEKGLALAAELGIKLKALLAELEQYLPKELPFLFTWTNRYHLSPLIFGGVVNYDSYEYDLADGTTILKSEYDALAVKPARMYAHKDETHVLLTNGKTLELALWEHLQFTPDGTDTEAVRYAGGKNAGEHKTKKVKVDDLTKPKGRQVKAPFQFAGFTAPLDEWKSSTPGLWSVAADVIEALGNRRDVPFLQLLSKVTAMSKDLKTYFITTDEETGEQKGMLTLVQADSIIHHMLNHTSTVTGRFSSSNPNLQNIPKGNKSEVKTVFESRFTPAYMMDWLSQHGKADTYELVNSAETQALLNAGGSIGQSDFSSLEVYVQAILTSCKRLIDDLKSGIDLHVMRLALKEHMEYEDVFKLCKGYTDKEGVYHESVDEWDYKRTGAKVFSFQRAYGAGNPKIATSTGMPLEEVEALANAEKERWPEIDEYFEKRTEEIRRARKPTNVTVPHPDNPAIMVQLGISRVRTPDGKLYTYRETTSMSYQLKRGILASFSPTEIKNYEVQGTGGEWMKAAMWLMVRAWYERDNFGGLSLLVNTVHDAAYSDSHNSVRDKAAAVMHACMEGASDFMSWWFNWNIPLPVPSDTVWGRDMGEENKFSGDEFKAQVREVRAQLRRDYMQGFVPVNWQ